MQSGLYELEVVVRHLQDVKRLCRTWAGLSNEKDLGQNEPVVRVSLDGQLPEEKVCLSFHAPAEALDELLNILKHTGVKLTCTETLPGIGQVWRLEPDET